MNDHPIEVTGFHVHSSNHKRTVRLDLLIKDGETLTLDVKLPILTRLTEQLIDAEYEERRPAQAEIDGFLSAMDASADDSEAEQKV